MSPSPSRSDGERRQPRRPPPPPLPPPSPPTSSEGRRRAAPSADAAQQSASAQHSTPRSASPAARSPPAHAHVAHHVAEFGAVDRLVHLADDRRGSDSLPAPHMSRKDSLARRERWARLRSHLFAERHLMQYFHAETLYRTEEKRTIGPDELFLDLVIVGGIAALGHELRETFGGWSDVEKFLLLFAAIYSGWRSLVMLWNLWDVRSDLVDKASIYVVFFCLTGVALGAHGAFSDGPRPYVAVCAFGATAVPTSLNVAWSLKEPLLHNPQNIVNQVTLIAVYAIGSSLPYLAAAFVRSERVTRNLFWIPVAVQCFSWIFTGTLYKVVHRNRQGYSRLAVAIELMVEKYEVLTMIVLGESVLGLLFEAALLITADGIRIGHLYGAAAAATVMLYALQTLYVNVDGQIVKGGVHALRHRGVYGFLWGQLHMLYHIALILFATGLGIAVRDIAIPPSSPEAGAVERAVGVIVRAAEPAAGGAGIARFQRPQRWLFSAGWGASILLSGAIGALHLAGPRAATKWSRLTVRALLATGVMVGMPFADVSAGKYVVVHASVLLFIAVAEFLCHHMDSMGFFRSEFTTMTGSNTGNTESFDTEESDEIEKIKAEVSRVCNQTAEPQIALALEQRLRKRHCNRLVAVKSAADDRAGDAAEGSSGDV